MLSRDVSPETAEFVWFAMIEYLEPWRLTPHPDDHLVKDLPLGKSDPASDWLPRFARFHGANSKAWPQWPENWERTVRNFARWLELGLSQQS